MKANPDKCHFTCSSNAKINIMVEKQKLSNNCLWKTFRWLFNRKLKFQSHVIAFVKWQHLNDISKIMPYMYFNKKQLAVNALFSWQFNYCLLIWMCHNRKYTNKINRLHERCLWIIFNDKQSSFKDLFEKNNCLYLPKNLHTPAT